MDLRQLSYFVAVAEELHFERAAKRVAIQQPALSQQIRNLENGLGVRLLARTTRSTRLTSAGEIFLPEAKRILKDAESIRRWALDVKSGKQGRIRIGVSEDAVSQSFARLLASHQNEMPGVEIRVKEVDDREQLAELIGGRIDVALLVDRPISDDVHVTPLWRERIGVMVHRAHSLAQKERVEITDLAQPGLVVVCADRRCGCSAQILKLLEELGSRAEVRECASTRATVASMVAAGVGIAFAPFGYEACPQSEGMGVMMKPVDHPHAFLTTYAVVRSDEDCRVVLDLVHRAKPVESGSADRRG